MTASSALAADDPFLPRAVDRHLGRRQEPVPRLTPWAPSASARRDAAPVGDPAGGDDRHLAGDVDDRRHEHHRRDPPSVPASLGPWATSTSAPTSIAATAAPTSPTVCNQRIPRSWAAAIRSAGDTHVERDRRRGEVERGLERLRVERPSGVVDRKGSIGQLAQSLPLLAQLRRPTGPRCRRCRARRPRTPRPPARPPPTARTAPARSAHRCRTGRRASNAWSH